MQRAISFFILKFLIFFIGITSTFGQPYKIERTIEWQIIKNTSNSEKDFNKFFSFEGAGRDLQHNALPVLFEQLPIQSSGIISAKINNAVYAPAENDTNFTKLLQYLSTEISVNSTISIASKQNYALISLIPLRKNPETGKLEKLLHFGMEINVSPEKTSIQTTNALSKKGNTKNAVLANGKWNKIGFTETGVYKLDYNFLKQLNPDLVNNDPRNIRIYGKQGGMLPEANAAARDTDLVENAIRVIGEEDGVFNQEDYVLFYGQSQAIWKLNPVTKRFNHQINPYSDTSYFFITNSPEKGKRISVQPSLSATPSNVISTYDDYAFHEVDQWTEISKNIKSGREWYGEEFNAVTNYNFSFTFPAIDPSSQAYLRSWVAARANIASNFDITVNSNNKLSQQIQQMSLDPDNYNAYVLDKIDTFLLSPSPVMDIKIKYNKPNGSAMGWLNFMEMNVRSVLRFHSGQFGFRNSRSINAGSINEYRIQDAPGNIEVWDVTDFHNVKIQAASSTSNDTYAYKVPGDNLMEYVAFDGSRFLQPINFGSVPNQDLHGLSGIDMVILTHPNFYSAAQRLADFHKVNDKLTVAVITPQQVYNEFSSGAQDLSAIRDFMKTLYNNASSVEDAPQYLLLMGSASYDYKNRIKDNTNFIPTYQSRESLKLLYSYCSDDYFGFLDKNEGLLYASDLLDLGVGRMPVRTLEQANAMIDKVIRYHDPKTLEDWRNVTCFVADDEDGNAFLENSEGFTSYIDQTSPAINIDKIYIDAYKQESTPSGQRYPAATEAITKRMDAGTLIFTYYGHGGELGLAHERVLDNDVINSWNNSYRMPLFITGTCEFSRFDDPVRVSAGELCVLNPKGGAIASFTTTRVVTVGENERLGQFIYNDNIFKVVDGEAPRLGDILRKAKNKSGFSINTLNFTLLGDPALRLALPKHKVLTTEINAKPINPDEKDTLKALSYMTIKGIVADKDGKKLTSFNGVVYPTIYDKPQKIKTLRNDPGSRETNFNIRNSIIYKGKASVINGEFTFSFIVPKDISYQNAIGKISYYATDGKEDANGDNQQIVIGGTSDHIITDDKGPEIYLFINDSNFITGGLVDDTPVLIAKVRDDIGINTVGNGIGHELTGVLNNGEPIILNSYYKAKLDDYRAGEIRYQFSTLPDGQYNLKVKVWDVANNSSEAYTDFVVAGPNSLTLKKVFNYPNPFSEKTTFSFEHNFPDEDLSVEINIFDVRGALTKTIKATQNGNSSRVNNIEWDGRDDLGGPMAVGLYVYRLTVKTPDGKVAHQAQKLVVIR